MLPYRYPNIGLDTRQPISNFIQPDHHQHQRTQANIHSLTNNNIVSSQATGSKIKSSTTASSNNSRLIDGMANLTPTLLSTSVPFSQAQQQLQNQTSHQSSGSIQPQQIVQQAGTNNHRSTRVKNRSSTNAIGLNGIVNMPAQQIFGTSVAFPGNPLQSGQIQNQNFQHQSQQQQQSSRLNQLQQQQQHSGQQQTVLLPLEINPSQTRNLIANSSSSANVITSNNAAAVAAAVAVAHPQYSQYITSWPCPACKIAFRSASELQTHLSAHFVPSQKQTQNQNHSLVSPNLINNTFNKTTATSKEDQSVHLKKDKSVPCNECGKLFANAERVRVHVRVAHGEKTCSCAICGCGFSYRCKLLNHMRTHTGDKPFTCEVCGRSFSQKNHLKRHHMIHTGERPFPCEICGRSFYRKDKLTRHLRIHTNPSPGRGRNAKIPVTINQPANAALKIPMTQSLSSLPTSIQLLPVTMTQIKTSTTNSAIGQTTSWAQIQSTSNRQNNQNNVDNIKSNNESQNQQTSIMLKQEM